MKRFRAHGQKRSPGPGGVRTVARGAEAATRTSGTGAGRLATATENRGASDGASRGDAALGGAGAPGVGTQPGTAPSGTAGPCRFRPARSLAQPPPEREDGVTEAQVRGVTPCGARAAPTSLHPHVAPASQELGAELLPPGRVPCRCFSVWNITVQWSEKFTYATSIVPSF